MKDKEDRCEEVRYDYTREREREKRRKRRRGKICRIGEN